MSAPLYFCEEMCYATKRESNGCPLTLEGELACSKVIHGECSRCGKVGQSHFANARARNEKDRERERDTRKYKKLQKTRSYSQKKTQLRLM